MKVKTLSIAVLFFGASGTFYAQKDSLKTEKKIEGVTIKGTTKKGAENNIINLQKKSVEVVERVGSAQLSKQGVGDVATAVTKATGTQKQEGTGVIFVRGLGDRNNSTTMNGLPIPSSDPKYKNIDLSIFKTDIIEYLSLEKVYTPRIYGDMNGANIDIYSKEHSGKPYAKIELGSGVNFNSFQRGNFPLNQGPNYFGYHATAKPTARQIFNGGYVFQNSLENKLFFTPINSSLNVELGKTFNIGSGKLSVFAYGGFDNDFNYIQGPQNSYDAQGNRINELNREQNSYNTNTVGILNLFYRINNNHKVKFTSNYIHSTEQKLGIWRGFIRDIAENETGFIRRGEYKHTDLFVNQLSGDNKLSNKLNLFWNIGYNRLDSKRPDRTQNLVRQNDIGGAYSFSNNSTADNNRYFDDFLQNDFVGDVHLDYKLNDKGKITLGYQGRYIDTDFRATQFNFRIINTTAAVDVNNFSSFFNNTNYQAGYFDIRTYRGLIGSTPTAMVPAMFDSNQQNHSGYANIEYKLSDKISGTLGVRYDRLDQLINWDVQVFGTGTKNKVYNKFLPSLNVKYSVNDRNNLRFAASKTYTTPMIMEIAPFAYDEINETSYGNPDVKPADNYNADLKWEFFPKAGELISLAAFGKYIQNPISRITIVSAANEVSYVNSGDYGYVYGAEFELRKDLFKVNGKTKFYTFLNASYLKTYQELDNAKTLAENKTLGISTNFNTKSDKLQGASDFLGNINLGIEHRWKKNQMDFTVAYSYISDNIYSLGYTGRGNLVDKGFSTLDSTLKFKFENGIGISLSGKNLLNPYIKREQQNADNDLLVQSFRRGVRTSLGLSYQF